MSTLTAYLLGLATLPAGLLAGWATLYTLARVARVAGRHGWFTETGAPPETHTTWRSVVTVRRLGPLHFGVYRHLDGGSRWVALGPLVTIGRRLPHLSVTRDALAALAAEAVKGAGQ